MTTIKNLVTDGGFYHWKTFYKVKFVLVHPVWMIANLSNVSIISVIKGAKKL